MLGATLVDTSWGSIDKAKEWLEKDKELSHYPDVIEDNRGDPPDDGVVWRFGNGDVFEGDTHTVWIKKLPVLGLVEKKKKKRKAA